MKRVFPFIFLLTSVALADYAWIPKPETLVLKTGWELFKSENNYDSVGTKNVLTTNSLTSSLLQNQVFLEAEYGLGDQWSGIFRTGFLSAQIEPLNLSDPTLSGAGLFDTTLGFKWRFKREKPILALETGLILPPYSTKNLKADELALGDGVSGVQFRVHAGTQLRRFSFSLSPGLLFRFGRFSHQALLDAAVSLTLQKFYLRLFQSAQFSMIKDSASSQGAENSEPGSGGSYSRLATNPDLITLGLKVGAFLSPRFKLETSASHTVWGQTAADGFRVGVALITNLDFSTPDTRELIKEVPLNGE
ncbi:MAG: hypothetical protein EBQ92_05145 [Proteobacteria bacterium]|nr:hypothetical protein [Pseudomonadota bacterium]